MSKLIQLTKAQKLKAKRGGVDARPLVDGRLRLLCGECNEVWYSTRGAGGRLANGWWQCPHFCNCDEGLAAPGHIHSSEISPGAARIERHEMMELASRDAGLTAKERGQ